jgi:hypothetical protein
MTIWSLVPILALAGLAQAQGAQATETGPAAARLGEAGKAAFPPEQLEQIVAPIALYPDPLLAHVLMASTYPLEVVAAARWRQKNPKLSGDALEKALQEQTWDPAVKSLCDFPDVLARMNENLDWMQDLGDAFLAQQAEVMAAVQAMRTKALEAGTLESGKEQTVTQGEDQTIVIESADPEVVYVPTYYPSSCYGSWGYPYWYYPPMYAPPPAGGLWFGFTVGVIWGDAWGDCDWDGGDVNIDIDNENNFIDRTERPENRERVKDRGGRGTQVGRGNWSHDPAHRKGVGYRDSATSQRFADRAARPRVSNDQARGYGDHAATTRPSAPAVSDRSSRASAQRPTGGRSSSFSGSRSAGLERASSSRGSASRGSAGSRGGGRGGGGRGGRR